MLLRLEKGHIVVGVDTDFDCSPRQVGADWSVKMEKEYFVGKTALERLQVLPFNKKLHGFIFSGGTTPPEGTTLTADGEYVGFLTSSRYSHSLKKPIALGWLRKQTGPFPSNVTAGGIPGTITDLPFYDPKGERVRG